MLDTFLAASRHVQSSFAHLSLRVSINFNLNGILYYSHKLRPPATAQISRVPRESQRASSHSKEYSQYYNTIYEYTIDPPQHRSVCLSRVQFTTFMYSVFFWHCVWAVAFVEFGCARHAGIALARTRYGAQQKQSRNSNTKPTVFSGTGMKSRNPMLVCWLAG